MMYYFMKHKENELKNICLCLKEFKHTNIHPYMHVLTAPFQYQIPRRFFFLKAALSNFSAFLSNDS